MCLAQGHNTVTPVGIEHSASIRYCTPINIINIFFMMKEMYEISHKYVPNMLKVKLRRKIVQKFIQIWIYVY